jgi:hypothetical protein
MVGSRTGLVPEETQPRDEKIKLVISMAYIVLLSLAGGVC